MSNNEMSEGDKIDHFLEFIKQAVVDSYIAECEKQGDTLMAQDYRKAAMRGAKIKDYRIEITIPMKTVLYDGEMSVVLKKRQDNKQDVDL